MFEKTRDMLIQEAIRFIHNHIGSSFRGELIHSVEFAPGGRFEVTLYHKEPVTYLVTLFLDGRQPTVFKQTKIITQKTEVL